MRQKLIIGKEEWCALPDLALPAIKARVDSGAKTSALHAFNIKIHSVQGQEWVRFDVHPIQKDNKTNVQCHAKLVDMRSVRSSSGHIEKRPVIETMLQLGEQRWKIQLTLTNRDAMGYRMLLGREAMHGRLVVDPGLSLSQRKISEVEARVQYERYEAPEKPLRIAVLASNRDLYSNRRIMEAGEKRGHEMRFINIELCYINISDKKPLIHYRGGEVLPHFDAVIPRIKPAVTFYGCAVLRQFDIADSYCLNSALAINRSRDKLRSMQLLAQKSIPIPRTGFALSPLDTQDLVQMVGGAPLVIKTLEGTQGVGIVLAETNKAAESVINAFKSVKANILVQDFIKEAGGKDLRCFVVDGRVVAAMERSAPKGDFRANLHRGGTAKEVKITKQERQIAVEAARVMGLDVAGVDIIRSSQGPLVLEVNSSPGLEGIEAYTGQDIAGQMIACIERNIKAQAKAKKPKIPRR